MAVPDIGVFLPSMSDAGQVPGDMAASARHAEDLGFESVWVVDQLVAGAGSPLLDSGIALAAAAAVTTRVLLGYGVMILPLHPVVWVAKQVASLQHVSGDRVILGAGVGGDRHDRSWAAAGVPRRERGRRTDAALRVLPGLIAGEPTRVDELPDRPVIQLAPPATVPPMVIGGMSDAAVTRAVTHRAGWFLGPGAPDAVAQAGKRLVDAASGLGGAPTPITASLMTALPGDPAVPGHDALVRRLGDPEGSYAIPADYLDDLLFTGEAAALAQRLAAYGEAGAVRVVISVAAGDWYRQTELLAEARALIG
jgi:alkanesulfonate monooxygenase SsuD/methylene tetrahydromethanopterin reductase-like flavin-dependent oxidoreductase (luciferase family)